MHYEKPNIDERANLLIYGVGHSGTTILTKMLFAVGWSQGGPPENVDDQFSEHMAIRACNRHALTYGQLPPNAGEVFAHLESPWAVKDPRFVQTLPLWQELLLNLGQTLPVVVWIIRSIEEVKSSYLRRGELVKGEPGTHGRSVEALWSLASQHYDRWRGPKLSLHLDQIRNAAAMFQPALISHPSTTCEH